MMENQEPVSSEERPDCLERVTPGRTGPISHSRGVEMTQVHGVDIKGHVGSAEQDKVVDQPMAEWWQQQAFREGLSIPSWT